ncbi:nitrate reductase [Azospirillum cavernae]|uniref:Nitrate reductase n=1 Tax=Azospirillum cavernae TaxID=2320860 RepID=A0A418VXV8_9PROT|nr:periplasmic nitrate reductase, NapE protein [Azospirillum cavernae]RJF81920.1 nitrate reductase [Azospirillum cavernae]
MTPSTSSATPSRRAETLMFLALSVLVWPLIAVGSVGAYGFSIWIYQMLTH